MKGYTILYEHLMKNAEVWKPKVRTDTKVINEQKFMEEVIIPELGVRFIMEDLGVNYYDTALKITQESIKYSNQHFSEIVMINVFSEKINRKKEEYLMEK
ncbi:20092_t:CDS:1, partial [Gigaspora rosea]